MACESKKISELTKITTLNPGDLIPIVQDGENKAVTVQDLLCQKPKGNCCEDKKTLSEILLAANKALEMARVAWKMSNKAFNEVCSLKEKVNALDVAVSDLQQILCQFENFKNWVINHFDQLERSLAITIEKGTSINGQFTTYTFKQGGVAISPVVQQPRMAPSLNAIYNEWPVTVEQILQLKSDMSQRLYFRAGKFEQNGQYYNGLQEVDAIYIPTRINHLDDGENVITGINVGYNDNKPAQIVNNIATIPSFGGYTGNGIPVKLTGGKAYIDPADVEDKLDLNLDDLGDVETPNPHDGDVIYYNGTEWVNVPIATLISQNLDCEAVKACFSTENFNVAPLVVTLEYNERVANFAVTSSGAWKIQKVTSGDNVFTASIQDNVHQNPGTNLPLVITANSDNTSGQDREVEWDVIPWITVPGLIETQRIKVIQEAQATPPTPTNRTITYNISGGQTNSIKVNNEVVGNGGQKTAPDGSNYTVPIVSNDPGYRISSVTPSAGTYNTGTGTLTINPITADVTVQVVLEQIPAGQVTITYTGDIDKVASGLPSGNQTIVSQGDSYTNTITPITGYQFNNIVISPSGTGDVTTGNISIPQVNANTTIEITASTTGHSLSINPTTISINSEGTSLPIEVTVTNNCSESSNITIDDSQLPQGITVTRDSQTGNLLVEADPGIPFGNYIVTITNECGDTAQLTITTPLPYFDYSISEHSTGYFTPYGVPEEGTIEAVYAHHRDGFIDGVYNGITISHDTQDNSWNLTFPYPGQNGINDLEISYGGSESTNPRFQGTIIDNQNGTYTAKCAPVLGDLTTDSNYPIQAQNAADYEYGITVYVIVKGGSEFYNSYLHGVLDFAYVLAFGLDQINYHYYNYDTDYITYVNTSGETGKQIHGATIGGIPRSEFTLTLDQANTSSWIHNVDLTNETFDCDPGTAGTEGTIGFILNWNNPSSGSLSTTRTIKYIQE